jgi:phage recombination protein Bet
MTTDVALRPQSTELTIEPDAVNWTPKQVAALRQLGVSGASNADLAVFFHQCVKTGLDPFARQIYMIERQGKQTIQTGIDGFRLIARRAVDRAKQSLAFSETFWCGSDGQWVDVWLSADAPKAAKITVYRQGDPCPGIAHLTEYVGTKRDGTPNAMWASKPALMLAKCAEALALRRAFPQDLSGIYIPEELAQDIAAETPQGPATRSAGARLHQLTASDRVIERGDSPTEEDVAAMNAEAVETHVEDDPARELFAADIEPPASTE